MKDMEAPAGDGKKKLTLLIPRSSRSSSRSPQKEKTEKENSFTGIKRPVAVVDGDGTPSGSPRSSSTMLLMLNRRRSNTIDISPREHRPAMLNKQKSIMIQSNHIRALSMFATAEDDELTAAQLLTEMTKGAQSSSSGSGSASPEKEKEDTLAFQAKLPKFLTEALNSPRSPRNKRIERNEENRSTSNPNPNPNPNKRVKVNPTDTEGEGENGERRGRSNSAIEDLLEASEGETGEQVGGRDRSNSAMDDLLAASEMGFTAPANTANANAAATTSSRAMDPPSTVSSNGRPQRVRASSFDHNQYSYSANAVSSVGGGRPPLGQKMPAPSTHVQNACLRPGVVPDWSQTQNACLRPGVVPDFASFGLPYTGAAGGANPPNLDLMASSLVNRNRNRSGSNSSNFSNGSIGSGSVGSYTYRPRASTMMDSNPWEPMQRLEGMVGMIGIYGPEERRLRIARFIEKRRARVWTKKVKYDVRKNFADSRIRVKGRFIRKDEEISMLTATDTDLKKSVKKGGKE